MGLVYEAVDERLDRRVALKIIHWNVVDSPGVRERFRREARLAASINHPHVCQIYDIGDEDGLIFIAMEKLEGEPLSTRLSRGALPLTEAVDIGLGMLGALDALHRRNIVHRDLKPSNVFLTPHGIKLLDFGLARPIAETQLPLTLPGAVLGTPKYMAPERIQGDAIDERVDLFAAGVILYEMLTGTCPFDGDSIPTVIDRILRLDPPMIGGSPGVAAADRVIHRSLAKAPELRYADAVAMATDLRAVLRCPDNDETRRASTVTRLIVLPFRFLKPDADTDFLAFGLADALSSSLSAINTLVVRSSLIAARFASEVPNFQTIAAEASVDVILSGTLLRAGSRLRVAVQLVEAPSGRLIWADASQVDVGDIFQLQDDLSHRIVESLVLPLSGRERRALAHDVPSSAQAFEFYLRANQLSREPTSLDLARDMYLQALQADPKYAPAWARLGHLYRVMGKYRSERDTVAQAESALNRALELNPDLSFADRVYAQIEVDYGRAEDALVRLMRRASTRVNDPELFVGLVHSCRYCGLFQASIAAHERARRLDPNVRTSLQYTLLMSGDYTRAVAEAGGLDSVAGMALTMAGDADAPRRLRQQADLFMAANMAPAGRFCEGVAGLAEGNVSALRSAVDAWIAAGLRDPEALFIHGLLLAGGRDDDRALELMSEAVSRGYLPYDTLTRHRWLNPLRDRADFKALVHDAHVRHEHATTVFMEAGGIAL
jgi:serine/threonine protein kinase